MDQGAGETEEKLRPSVETRGIHRCADGRPPSRTHRLGQNQREKGLSFFSPCLVDICLFMLFVCLAHLFPLTAVFLSFICCSSHSRSPCLTSSSWMQSVTCWIWSQLWPRHQAVCWDPNIQGWATALLWSRSEVKTHSSPGARPTNAVWQRVASPCSTTDVSGRRRSCCMIAF